MYSNDEKDAYLAFYYVMFMSTSDPRNNSVSPGWILAYKRILYDPVVGRFPAC